MAVTVEYIIILVGRLEYYRTQVARIEFTKTTLTFKGNDGKVIYEGPRLGDKIFVSGTIAGLSIGYSIMYIPLENNLLALVHDSESVRIECELLNTQQ